VARPNHLSNVLFLGGQQALQDPKIRHINFDSFFYGLTYSSLKPESLQTVSCDWFLAQKIELGISVLSAEEFYQYFGFGYGMWKHIGANISA
jgi:hypothetical protein